MFLSQRVNHSGLFYGEVLFSALHLHYSFALWVRGQIMRAIFDRVSTKKLSYKIFFQDLLYRLVRFYRKQ